jgi:hypothetical protein
MFMARLTGRWYLISSARYHELCIIIYNAAKTLNARNWCAGSPRTVTANLMSSL